MGFLLLDKIREMSALFLSSGGLLESVLGDLITFVLASVFTVFVNERWKSAYRLSRFRCGDP